MVLFFNAKAVESSPQPSSESHGMISGGEEFWDAPIQTKELS